MSKQNTLLNFFTKVPSPATNKKTPNKNAHLQKSSDTPKHEGYKICDIIWAKLDPFPWWPSIICKDPNTKKFENKDKIHVQFFDNPPTRGWIKKQNVKLYISAADIPSPSKIKKADAENLKIACEEADKAVKLGFDDRADLLIDFQKAKENRVSSDDDEMDSPGTDKENNDKTNQPMSRKQLFDFEPDGSEDEYKPEAAESSDEPISSAVESDEEAMETDDEEENDKKRPSPRGVKRKRKPEKGESSVKKIHSTPVSKANTSTATTPSTCRASAKVKLTAFKNASILETPSKTTANENWPHLTLPFLQPGNIMDKNKRKPDHPEYNPRTLYIPDTFKNNCTPAVRQWWEMKADHYDCVLFFKVGKFYELYHMDAVIGINELSLTYMRGEFAHCGFPEIAYGRFATILVEKGYKVARVEQTETPDMMTERVKQQHKTTKFDKVVNREICQITTRGTQIFSFLDGEAKESDTHYLLALSEKEEGNKSTYGVCFIDASIGIFHVGQFEDDRHCSRLRTLVAHYPPVQVLYEKGHISHKTEQILKSVLMSAVKEGLSPKSEFWTATKTLTVLSEEKYFTNDEGGRVFPETINKLISEADSLGLTPSPNGELAIKALGACVWYLRRSFLDQQLLAMNKFETYSPVDSWTSDVDMEDDTVQFGRYMILDGITLSNLEVLVNPNGSKHGTLLEKLDKCSTFSGQRLIRQWLCSPLCNIESIQSRQEAVKELLDHAHLVQEVRAKFNQLPDLERLLGKIHTQGNAIRSQTHPDSRAIFFEDKVYSKRKIQDFLLTLNGFKNLQKAIEFFQTQITLKSHILKQCTSFPPDGKFPDLLQHLKFFEDAFDHEEAKKEGCIIPQSSGVDVDYDEVVEELKNLEKELAEYLKSQCKKFGVQVKYFGSDKNRFQLEMSDSCASKTTSEYELSSSRKGFKRYSTPVTKDFLKRQMAAELKKANILKDLSRRVFAKFSEKYEEWNTGLHCMAVLDVLMSLAEYARTENGEVCVPSFTNPKTTDKPFIIIKDGRHPSITVPDGFIPNDTELGKDGSLILLTGPNMGGKSTLMRQSGTIVILAHIGAHVPASSCHLTPVDRIFTRIGASDDILAGESTFFVELRETSLFLHQATKHSLVLVDELGRGTSTYDGTAIAYAVVNELAERNCRTIFSTHYHTLVEDFKNSKSVILGHMACMVETDVEDPTEENVTFLYKYSPGACPKSYGFNAAKLAGVPLYIIKVGRDKALQLEKEGEKRKLFTKIFQGPSEELAPLMESISLVI